MSASERERERETDRRTERKREIGRVESVNPFAWKIILTNK